MLNNVLKTHAKRKLKLKLEKIL